MIKHILFDWDNTLSMTEASTFDIENEAAALLGLKAQSRKVHKETISSDFKKSLSLRFPGADVDKLSDIIYTQIFPKYIGERKTDAISESNINALKQLKKRGYLLYILTSRIKEGLNSIDIVNNIGNLFEDRYYLERTIYSKPDPRVFDVFFSDTKAKPEECLYVGDNPDDICAKVAGMNLVITLESGLKTKRDFKDGFVDGYIYDLSELPDAIAKLESKDI